MVLFGPTSSTPSNGNQFVPDGLMTMRRVMHDVTGRIVELGDHRYDATQYSVDLDVIES